MKCFRRVREGVGEVGERRDRSLVKRGFLVKR